MEILVCCIGARSWTKIIALIQIILFTLGVLVVGIGLVTVLVAGADAVNKSIEENPYPYPENISHSSGSDGDRYRDRHRNLAYVSEYLKLVVVLSVCVALLILGLILAVFLIKGANESKSLYLKWWMLHAVICWGWLIIAEVLSADSIFTFVLRISVPTFLYGFAISVVVALLREIQKEQEGQGQNRNRNRNRKRVDQLPPRSKKATDKINSTHSDPESVVSSIIDPVRPKNQSKV